MQAIKSFVYLDEYKMYSVSSQIFEGITEYLIDYQETTTGETESQRGPFGSGRVMADILKSASRTEERKYLHDYSYSLFEQELLNNNRVIKVSEENIHGAIESINDTGFIAVRGTAIFNDMRTIKSTMNRFNDLGEAIAYVTNFDEIQNVRHELDASVAGRRRQKCESTASTEIEGAKRRRQVSRVSGLATRPYVFGETRIPS